MQKMQKWKFNEKFCHEEDDDANHTFFLLPLYIYAISVQKIVSGQSWIPKLSTSLNINHLLMAKLLILQKIQISDYKQLTTQLQ